jgi:hypothetical protein
MTAAGCGTVEVNTPQHSIKQREKCGLAEFYWTAAPDFLQIRIKKNPKGASKLRSLPAGCERSAPPGAAQPAVAC